MDKLLFCFNFFLASKIYKKHNYQKQGSSNLESGNIICQINHNSSSNFSSAKTPTFQNIITPKILNINTLNSLVRGIAAAKSTTAFAQIFENIFNWAGVIVNISYNLAITKSIVNFQIKTLYNLGAARFGPATGAP